MNSDSSRRGSSLDLLRSPHLATVVVLLLAYLLTYIEFVLDYNSPGGASFTLSSLLLGSLLGIIYLYLMLQEEPPLQKVLGDNAKAVLFLVLTGLMMAIQFLMAGSNGIWLISMPLVALATTELQGVSRWLIYLAALVGLAAPLYLVAGPTAALAAALTFSPAIVFVAVFARLTEKAEQAQAEAEALSRQLESANRQLSEYAVQAEELAATQERNRLARDIHDNLGHYLTVVNVQIKAAQAVMDADPKAAQATLTKARRQTEEGLAAIRQSVSALRASPLGQQSLDEAIGELAADAEASGLVVTYELRGEARRLTPQQELTLFRAAQEALTNIRRHAAASRVAIYLDFERSAGVALTVTDNGVGTDMASHRPGFGLIGLGERVHQLDGELLLTSQRGEGFSVTVRLPQPASPGEQPGANDKVPVSHA